MDLGLADRGYVVSAASGGLGRAAGALSEALGAGLQRTRNGTELLPDLTIDLIVMETIVACS
jgi:hypothetical protein